MSTDDVIRGETTVDDMTADEDTASAPETFFQKVAGRPRRHGYAPDGATDETPTSGDVMAGDPTVTDPDLPPVATGYTGGTDATGVDAYGTDADITDADLDDADLDQVPVLASSGTPLAGNTTPVSSTSESLIGDASSLTERWRQVAAEFVDDPRAAAGQAADVAADAVTMLETSLRERRAAWEGNGNGTSNGNGDTEAMRQAVLGYRRILDKLLS